MKTNINKNKININEVIFNDESTEKPKIVILKIIIRFNLRKIKSTIISVMNWQLKD